MRQAVYIHSHSCGSRVYSGQPKILDVRVQNVVLLIKFLLLWVWSIYYREVPTGAKRFKYNPGRNNSGYPQFSTLGCDRERYGMGLLV